MSELDIDIARKLKQRRVELGLTQKQVAEKLGVTRGNVTQFEMGRNKLKHGVLQKIAEIYERPASFFVGDEKQYFKTNVLNTNKAELEDIIKNWKLSEYITEKKLPDQFVEDLKTYLEYLCELYDIKMSKIW